MPNGAATSPEHAARIVGRSIDLEAVSRTISGGAKAVRCFDLLPGGTKARVVWGRPAEAVDLDLKTGQYVATSLRPETFKTGCPRLSPDSARVIYTEGGENAPRIMIGLAPDGHDPQPVTEGSFPVWLPSGKEFVYSFDRRRGAMFSLPATRLLFKDTEPLEKKIQDIAVSERGDRIAFLFLDTHQASTVEVYSYPAMSLLTTARTQKTIYTVAFDTRRGSLLATVPDPARLALTEVTDSGDLDRLGQVDGTNVLWAFRSSVGLTYLTSAITRHVVARSPDGAEKTIEYAGAYSIPVFSASRTALLERRLADGRLVIAVQGWKDPDSRPLTAGPDDAYPSIEAGGRIFAYVRMESNTLMGCSTSSPQGANCHPIVADPLGPRMIALSPDGETVAYFTATGAKPRTRVVPFSGGPPRDLGAFPTTCNPVWSSRSGISYYDEAALQWIEIDTNTGAPTGKILRATAGTGPGCDVPPAYTISDLETKRTFTIAVDVRVADSI